MAGPKKVRKLPKPDSNEEQSDEESEDYEHPMEIQATFEGRNPEGQDFHGIKQLLHQLFLTAHIDLSQMSDLLIAQTGVGSVLKQSCTESDDEEDVDMVDETDVFGITSVINLTQHKETPCVQQFYNHLLEETENCSDKNMQVNVKEILHSPSKIGLLINERFINIPSKISYPMLNSLQDEIQRMKKKNDGYSFDYYVIISKMWKPKGDTDDEMIFSNDEEEFFFKKSDCNFSYSVAGKADTGLTGKWKDEDKEMLPYRRVTFFKADKFQTILSEIQQFVSN